MLWRCSGDALKYGRPEWALFDGEGIALDDAQHIAGQRRQHNWLLGGRVEELDVVERGRLVVAVYDHATLPSGQRGEPGLQLGIDVPGRLDRQIPKDLDHIHLLRLHL